jgi:hypothetical protein
LRAAARHFGSAPRTGAAAGIYELRTYTLHPHATSSFLKHAQDNAELRLRLFPNLLGFFSSDVGGCLHQVRALLPREHVTS